MPKMETVASAELNAGDVFALVDPPEDVVGEVFWKHPRLKRVKRVMDLGAGEIGFSEIQDMASQVYFGGPFKRARVIRIMNFQPQEPRERLVLPW